MAIRASLAIVVRHVECPMVWAARVGRKMGARVYRVDEWGKWTVSDRGSGGVYPRVIGCFAGCPRRRWESGMAQTIFASELAQNLSEVLERVRDHGERFVVELDGRPIADLAPRSADAGITLGEFLDRLLELGDPDEDYAADVRAGVAAQGPVRIDDWTT